jgi:hypothetical protein
VNEAGNRIPSVRRKKAYVSIWGTTQLHLRNPYVIALWSAIFPGFGHMMLAKYINGIILFLWEVGLNYAAHLNEAIIYSFLGKFELAKQVLDTRWLLFYIPTYLFTVWDSYRICVDLNNQYVLAAREDAPMKPIVMHPLGLNYLDKTSPWAVFFWCIISPGAGQIIQRNSAVAYFLLIWWITIVFLSKALPAIHYTFLGQFDAARAVVNPQWLLNIPSVYLFAMYDAHVSTVESNKLFDWEQSKFLKSNYQDHAFPMPFGEKGSGTMYIISNFEHTIKLETAITAVEMKGVPRGNILAVPMDKRNEDRMLFDRMHSSDSLSMLDLPMITAAVFAVFGLIYGFVLTWGPILWALIGTAFGFGVGLLVKLYTIRRRKQKQRQAESEVVLLIACDSGQMDMVQETLWAYSALGVAKLSLGDDL